MKQSMPRQQFPAGWDEDRVQRLIKHYDEMDDDAIIVEDQAAHEMKGQTLMVVPTELVSTVRELIAAKQIKT